MFSSIMHSLSGGGGGGGGGLFDVPEPFSSGHCPRFCGVPYTIDQLRKVPQEFIQQVKDSLAKTDGPARHRTVLESFYAQYPKKGIQILHIIAEFGLIEIGTFILSLLAENPLCPTARYTQGTTEGEEDSEQKTLTFALYDFGISGLDDSMIKNLPHPLSSLCKGKSPLAFAVDNQHVHITRLFIAHGADPNQINHNTGGFGGRTNILHSALWSSTDNSELLKALLESEHIDVDATVGDNLSAVYVAAQNFRVEYVKLLFEAGANINKTPQGASLLAALAATGRMLGLAGSNDRLTATADYLLSLAQPNIPKERRLDIFARDVETHANVLHVLTKSALPPEYILKVLRLADQLEPPDPAFSFSSQETLSVQSIRRAGGVARLLTARDRNGDTPLMAFIENGLSSADFKDFLNFISSVPIVDTPNFLGVTPMMAVPSANSLWIDILIELGGDINVTNCNGVSPLSRILLAPSPITQPPILVGWTGVDGIRKLLDAGADINCTNPCSGRSLGHIAVLDLANEMDAGVALKYLLAEGLDSELRDNEGLTLIHHAAKSGYVTLIEQLATHCDIHATMGGGSKKTIVHLIANPDRGMFYGNSGRRRVAVENPFEVLKNIGCDLNAPDCRGNTALHLAALEWDEVHVKALIAAGCDASAKNLSGETALDIAKRLLIEHEEPASNNVSNLSGGLSLTFVLGDSKKKSLKSIIRLLSFKPSK